MTPTGSGCSMLFLAAVALVVGFIPILNWITLFVALPLSLIGMATSGNAARQPRAQQADKATLWLAVALTATIVIRMGML